MSVSQGLQDTAGGLKVRLPGERARRDSNPQPSVPKTDDSNPQPKDSISGCDNDEKRLARALHSVSSTDVDLLRVVAAWPRLPQHVRLAILVLTTTGTIPEPNPLHEPSG